jgi:hypothetical protein
MQVMTRQRPDVQKTTGAATQYLWQHVACDLVSLMNICIRFQQ